MLPVPVRGVLISLFSLCFAKLDRSSTLLTVIGVDESYPSLFVSGLFYLKEGIARPPNSSSDLPLLVRLCQDVQRRGQVQSRSQHCHFDSLSEVRTTYATVVVTYRSSKTGPCGRHVARRCQAF